MLPVVGSIVFASAKLLGCVTEVCGFAGSGFELFSAAFEPQEHTAWLKCLVFKFCLIAQRPLDEANLTLSESERAINCCTQPSDCANISSPPSSLSATGNMPQTENHSKAVNRKKKVKGRSHASASTASSHQNTVGASPDRHQDVPQAPAVHSSSHRKSKALREHSMAVPAAANSEAVISNGLAVASPKRHLQGKSYPGMTAILLQTCCCHQFCNRCCYNDHKSCGLDICVWSTQDLIRMGYCMRAVS